MDICIYVYIFGDLQLKAKLKLSRVSIKLTCFSGTLGGTLSRSISGLRANLLVHIQIENPKGISQALMFAQQPLRRNRHIEPGTEWDPKLMKWMWMWSTITCSIIWVLSLSER